jgi:hypothetical protein
MLHHGHENTGELSAATLVPVGWQAAWLPRLALRKGSCGPLHVLC